MTKRYTGGVISSSLPTVNAAGASGVFLLSQQADYQSRNSWPPFKVEESLRFRASAGAHLNRTPASAGNRKTMTFSFWVKRGFMSSTQQNFISAGTGSDNYIAWSSTNDNIEMNFRNGGSGSNVFLITTQVFRDPSAWYHIVLAIDTTQATAANRVKLYVNGTQITVFGTENYPTQNNDLNTFGNNVIHYIGQSGVGGFNFYLDGYLTEFYYVDGQQLTPSSFGATDKDGNWSPIAYTGTYGTNGFYVNFRDNTSATTMGYDYSGNGNNWTLNNFNVSTANTSYDIMIDVPEDQSDGTANNRGNYATLNPLDPKNGTQSNANLTHAMGSNDYAAARSTIGMRGDKWYWEATCQTTLQSNFYMGIGITADGDYSGYSYIGSTSGGYSYDGRATKLNNNSSTSYGATYTLNDIIGVALNLDTGTIEFYKNGASQGVAFTGIDTTRTYYAAHWLYTTQISYNFGQRPFAYAPPSGFKSLNTFNLPEPTIKQPNKQFDAVIWSGDSSSPRNITSYNFQPDFSWIKCRSSGQYHIIQDAIRGTNLNSELSSSETGAEGSFDSDLYGAVTSYLSNGFTVTAGSSNAAFVNLTGQTYVGWAWNAGNANTTNTSGTITSIVRANPTAGFSIVTWTGTGSTATVGHGLGVTPSMIIVKRRNAGSSGWSVYFTTLAAGNALALQSTNAAASQPNRFTTTLPTSSVFSIGTDSDLNANGGTYVAYCFTPIAGYSAFGSYTGNGSSNGPFVYTGFRPRFIMIKCSSDAQAWIIFDTARNPYNSNLYELYPNLTLADSVDTNGSIDIVSNGFKNRCAASANLNASGQTYIYAAFAEMPFKYARSR